MAFIKRQWPWPTANDIAVVGIACGSTRKFTPTYIQPTL